MKKLFVLPIATLLMLTGCNQPASGGGGGEPAQLTVLAKYDFSTVTAKGTIINADAANEKFGSYKVEGEGSITISEITRVYEGNSKGGAEAWSSKGGLLKLGVGTENAKLVFTTSETVKKVVLNCHSYYAKSADYPNNTTNLVKFNGGDAVALPYNEEAKGEDLEFTMSGTSVTIETYNPEPTDKVTAGRGFLFTLTLYK